jgi:hypothetical protein
VVSKALPLVGLAEGTVRYRGLASSGRALRAPISVPRPQPVVVVAMAAVLADVDS